jgi:hypothetical protein
MFSKVRIVGRERLEEFARTWKNHHPLTPEQMTFAGREVYVGEISVYHGGDLLYVFGGVPGFWHEQFLEPIPRRELIRR